MPIGDDQLVASNLSAVFGDRYSLLCAPNSEAALRSLEERRTDAVLAGHSPLDKTDGDLGSPQATGRSPINQSTVKALGGLLKALTKPASNAAGCVGNTYAPVSRHFSPSTDLRKCLGAPGPFWPTAD